MALFKVTGTVTIYVDADKPEDAEEYATKHLADEIRWNGDRSWDVVVDQRPTVSIECVEAAWRDSIPYGGDGETTLSELLG